MREHAYCGVVFPYRSGTYCVCSSVHVPKVHTESNHGVGVHVVTSLVPLTIDYMVVLFFAVVVHYAGVYVYMYIHTVHRAVLDQCFVCLFF